VPALCITIGVPPNVGATWNADPDNPVAETKYCEQFVIPAGKTPPGARNDTRSPATNEFVALIEADAFVNVAAAEPVVPAGVWDVAMLFADAAASGPTLTIIGRIA
jgi:hypothetical protein